jgi:hypothetical protein
MRFSLFAVIVALAASMSANACSSEGGHCITQADCCEDDNLYLVCEIHVSIEWFDPHPAFSSLAVIDRLACALRLTVDS